MKRQANKKLWTSKTLWVNGVAFVAMALQSRYGLVTPPEAQVGLLALVNLVLRMITKSEISW